MSKKKEYKVELRKQQYANEGNDAKSGFTTFGIIFILLGMGYGYLCYLAKADDLVQYMAYPVGFGLLFIVVGNLINKKHQTRIQQYEQYEQQRKATKRI